MIKRLYIDFETRSEADLKVVGQTVYSKHPSTHVLCVAYGDETRMASRHARLIVPDFVLNHPGEYDEELDFEALRKPPPVAREYVSHNASFEIAIWKNIMTPRFGWPEVPLSSWYDTQAAASAAGLPMGLVWAVEALGLSVPKDVDGGALMRSMCKPRTEWLTKGKGKKWDFDASKIKRLTEYCEVDVVALRDLYHAMPKLTPSGRKHWVYTATLNQRGVPVNSERAAKIIELIDAEKEPATARLIELTDGRVARPSQSARIQKELARLGLNLPSMGKEILEKLDLSLIHPRAAELICIRLEHGKASVTKAKGIVAKAATDGRLHDEHIDHGAHTGRWTCRGVQLHNVVRPLFERVDIERDVLPAIDEGDFEFLRLMYGTPTNAMVSSMRSLIEAEPGHLIYCADYSAIEARGTFWLVGEEGVLESYRQGLDLYKVMAAQIFKAPYSEVTKFQRNLGKQAILALGYQMGAVTFRTRCLAYGIEVSKEFSEMVKNTYRDTYAKIPKAWYALNDAAIKAVKTGREVKTKYKGVSFRVEGRWLCMRLPSGRDLRYCDPKIILNRFEREAVGFWTVHPVSKKWVQDSGYGGKWMENLIQGLSADLMYSGMIAAERKGYKCVLTVHDEALAHVPLGFGSVEEFEGALATLPPWALGMPLAAEGWASRYYGK